MRSSTALFQAVLFALASASPRPENALVARADDLSPEVAQLVADNGATAGCYSSTSPPPIPAKLRKRQDELAQESCPAQDLSVCKRGFIPLCCLPELFVVNGPPVGLIESGCSLLTLANVDDCPASHRQCCLQYVRNPFAALNPEEYTGWGLYCYNPDYLFGSR